jgi:hypothetical protein
MSVIPCAEYTDELESLFKSECEKSECLAILHSQSYIKYGRYSVAINIPVIILSSFVGFISNIHLFVDQNIFLGAMSLLVSLMKTLDSYFDFTKRCENHRLTSLSYGRIAKLIQIQLSLERENCIAPNDLLSVITHDLQNLKDSEPVIDADIVETFKEKYKDYAHVSRPSVCNGLTTITIVKPSSTKPDVPTDTPKVHIRFEPKTRIEV